MEDFSARRLSIRDIKRLLLSAESRSATTGPPKIGTPGPVAATILGPPGLLAALQPCPLPENLLRHSWSPSAITEWSPTGFITDSIIDL